MTLLLSGGFNALFSCDITMETAKAAGGSRDQVQVKLFVECIHKRCPVKIEDTQLTFDGLMVVKQGQWQKVEPGIYRLDLIVSLGTSAKGGIRVLRKCPKTGLQEEELEIVRL